MEKLSKDNLLDEKYKFSDLVDIPQLTDIFTKFSKVTGFTIGLVDNNSLEVLVKTAGTTYVLTFTELMKSPAKFVRKAIKYYLQI